MKWFPLDTINKRNEKYIQAFLEHDERLIAAFYYEQEKNFKHNLQNHFSYLPVHYIDDIFQDSIVQLEDNIHRRKITAQTIDVPLGGYLYKIGVNIANWYIRELHILLPQDDKDTEKEENEEMQDMPKFKKRFIPLDERLPIIEEDQAPTEHDCILIRKYVEQLQEPCATVLGLFYFKDYSMQQIAQQMNYKNSDVAKTRKNKCMNKLMDAINQRLYGYFEIHD